MRFNNTDISCYVNITVVEDDGTEHRSKSGALFKGNVAEGLLEATPEILIKLIKENRIRIDIKASETEKSLKKVSFS